MNDQQSPPLDSISGSSPKMPSRRSTAEGVALSSDHRMYATLAHLLGIVSGPLGPLVIWIIMKRDPFVEREAREALNFQIYVWLVLLVGALLTSLYIGDAIVIIATVLNVVFCVIAASFAHSGRSYRYPFALRLIDSSI